MENRELLERKLSTFEIDFNDLEHHVKPDRPEAILLLTGTFSQDLATPTSDLDLMLVYPEDCFVNGFNTVKGSERFEAFPLRETDSVFPQDQGLIVNRELSGGQKIQTYITRADQITRIQNGVRARNDSFRERINGGTSGRKRGGRLLFFVDQLIIHRFYTGLVIYNESGAEKLRSKLSISELADNVGVRETSNIQAYYSDLKGQLALSGLEEVETFHFIHQRMIISLTIVLLAAVGEISAQEKLLFRLLKRHSTKIGEDVVEELLDRYVNIQKFIYDNPLEIYNFIISILRRARVKSPLVEAEFADWNTESVFETFKLGTARN